MFSTILQIKLPPSGRITGFVTVGGSSNGIVKVFALGIAGTGGTVGPGLGPGPGFGKRV
jgi:hypothetical protein